MSAEPFLNFWFQQMEVHMDTQPVKTQPALDTTLLESSLGTSFNDAVSGQFRNKANSSDQDKKR